MFGNTHAVADAIAEGLRTEGEATVVAAADAAKADLSDADLLKEHLLNGEIDRAVAWGESLAADRS